jgi:hypothetical protein
MYFKEHLKSKYDFENDYTKFIKDDIFEPAKKFLENQNLLGKKFYTDFKKCEKEWQNQLVQTDKVKKNLHS